MKFSTVASLLVALSFVSAELKPKNDRLRPKTITPFLSHSSYSNDIVHATSTSKDPKAVALDFVNKQFGLASKDYTVTSAYKSDHNGVTHVYLKQLLQGDVVFNGNINVNVDSKGQIISFGNSFAKMTPQRLGKTKLWSNGKGFATPTDAIKTLAAYLKVTMPAKVSEKVTATGTHPVYSITGLDWARKGEATVRRAYVQTSADTIEPAWEIDLPMKNNHFHAHVSADGKKVVSLNDWVADASAPSYKVIKVGDNDPEASAFSVQSAPANAKSSPKGWHDDGAKAYTVTQGNNVDAHENWSGAFKGKNALVDHRADGGKDLQFNFAYDPKETDPKKYIDTAVTNLFYFNNVMHDIFYQYGFDEKAGNFQTNNFGKGGNGNDAVNANAQDGSGTDNATFETPPDGQSGVMRMFIFDMTTPDRDGDLENDVIGHEFTHGISNRLTGGPMNTDCLPDGESGGMGEGWSDTYAITLLMKATDKPTKQMPVGSWVFGGKTIRTYNYSTDKKVNPTTYGYLNKPDWQEVHMIGEVWANVLYGMYWNLMAATNKFNPDWYSADKTAGNTLHLQLLTDGLKLQPCNPTFVSARDAILKAEQVLTAGKYKCAIWKAFAVRGVGVKAVATNAQGKVKEDFTTPTDCK